VTKIFARIFVAYDGKVSARGILGEAVAHPLIAGQAQQAAQANTEHPI